jgi:hypothetical protein
MSSSEYSTRATSTCYAFNIRASSCVQPVQFEITDSFVRTPFLNESGLWKVQNNLFIAPRFHNSKPVCTHQRNWLCRTSLIWDNHYGFFSSKMSREGMELPSVRSIEIVSSTEPVQFEATNRFRKDQVGETPNGTCLKHSIFGTLNYFTLIVDNWLCTTSSIWDCNPLLLGNRYMVS